MARPACGLQCQADVPEAAAVCSRAAANDGNAKGSRPSRLFGEDLVAHVALVLVLMFLSTGCRVSDGVVRSVPAWPPLPDWVPV